MSKRAYVRENSLFRFLFRVPTVFQQGRTQTLNINKLNVNTSAIRFFRVKYRKSTYRLTKSQFITMRNVEIKAKINNYENICKIAEELSGGAPTIISQDDTFYNVNEGRLKMRFYADEAATLVRYDRDDQEGPKLCDYELLQFTAEETGKSKLLDCMLKKCLGIKGRVVKERKLFMVGQTRIHIDAVKDLGAFMELEVVLRPEQTLEEGQDIAKDLQIKLGVKDDELIECAYVDLLAKKTS